MKPTYDMANGPARAGSGGEGEPPDELGTDRGLARLAVVFGLGIVVIIVAADLGRLPVRRALALVLPWYDKLAHFLLIGIFAFLVNGALRGRRVRRFGLWWLVGSFWLTVAVTLEEVSQLWLAGRAFDLKDLGANYAGILLFGRVGGWWSRRRSRGSGEGPGADGSPAEVDPQES